MTEKNKGGRPRLYTDSSVLEEDIEAYFDECQSRKRPMITKTGQLIEAPAPAPQHITGLCVHLAMDNDTLNNYQKRGDDVESGQFFGSVIARAKKRCEMYAVDQLFEGQKGNKADFVLKNNFKWEDRTKTDLELGGSIIQQIHAGRKRAKVIEHEAD